MRALATARARIGVNGYAEATVLFRVGSEEYIWSARSAYRLGLALARAADTAVLKANRLNAGTRG